MKSFAELREEFQLGLHLCKGEINEGTSYFFRKENGSFVYLYGYAQEQFTIYDDMPLDQMLELEEGKTGWTLGRVPEAVMQWYQHEMYWEERTKEMNYRETEEDS